MRLQCCPLAAGGSSIATVTSSHGHTCTQGFILHVATSATDDSDLSFWQEELRELKNFFFGKSR